MIYVYTALTALILATGQTYWKKAALGFSMLKGAGRSLPQSILGTIFSLNFVVGAFLYITATVVYLWLFSKYPFSIVQITMISFGLILSTAISLIIFKENLTLLNFVGVGVIIIGVFLVAWRV